MESPIGGFQAGYLGRHHSNEERCGLVAAIHAMLKEQAYVPVPPLIFRFSLYKG
jgi:hypothetical protein